MAYLVRPAEVLRVHSCIAKILDQSGIAGRLKEILKEDDHFNLGSALTVQ